jgi:hypothetical protein
MKQGLFLPLAILISGLALAGSVAYHARQEVLAEKCRGSADDARRKGCNELDDEDV